MFVYFIPAESKLSFEKINFQLDKFIPYQSCTVNSDCNNNEKCFNTKCYPTYRGTQYCNHFTGSWVLEDINGVQYLKCTCRYPNIVGQKFDGGNCDVDIACSPNGQLKSIFIPDLSRAECICKKDYKSLTYPQIGCKKRLPSEMEKTICESDELPISEAFSVFHLDYLNSLPTNKKCLKNPCSFNVLNGKHLTHTKFDPQHGCICNPRYGNFGVKFNNMNNYLITEGYDACGNIFKNEPNIETRVRLFTYFYINGEPPKSFIQFINLNPDYLVPELQKIVQNNKNLQINELWPHNYTQYIFENENYFVHARECFIETFLEIEHCYERLIRKNQMIDCDKIVNQIPKIPNRHLQSYNLLYKYPVCKYKSSQLADLYKNRYILNPYLLSYKEYRVLMRSNGIELYSWQDDKWVVNFAPSEFDKYEDTSIYPILRTLQPINANFLKHSLMTGNLL